MLKKSLKAGSMVVLILSLLFFIGCSNGTTDTDEDSGAPPIDTPDNPDPVVTRVVIEPGNVDVAQGEQFVFSAVVEGRNNPSQDVTWTVGPEETKFPGTIINSFGRLTVDTGEEVGKILTVTATSKQNPDIKASVEVKVLLIGPRFSWEPNKKSVKARESVTVKGYLRGFTAREFSATVRNTPLNPEYDFYVDRQNGLTGGTITAIGNSVDGSVTLTLNTATVELPDRAKSGIIRVTLMRDALEGFERDLVSLENAFIDFEVVSQYTIDDLGSFDIANVPKNGAAKDTANLTGAANGVNSASIKWTSLTAADTFIKRDEPAVATVTLTANTGNGGWFFAESINTATISNVNSFVKGSPAVSNIKNEGKTLSFDLAYDVIAEVLGATADTGIDIDLDNEVGTEYGLIQFLPADPEHMDPLPLLPEDIVLDNIYYTGTIAWSGEGITEDGKNFKSKRDGTLNAKATITLTPKLGYTFYGHNFTIEDLMNSSGDDKVYDDSTSFTNGDPIISFVEAPEDDQLRFELTYEVVEKVIDATAVVPGNFKSLINRPINGTAVGISSAFESTPESPYDGKVVWEGHVSNHKRFEAGDTDSIAHIILTPKPGYKFDENDYSGSEEALAAAVAVNAPDASGGNITSVAKYELSFDIEYVAGLTNAGIYTQIKSLSRGGDFYKGIDPVHGTTAPTATLTINPTTLFDSSINLNWPRGLKNGTTFDYGQNPEVQISLTPTSGDKYTFKALAGNDPVAELNAAAIAAFFAQVYPTGYPAPSGGRALVEVIDGPTLSGTGWDANLVFTLRYNSVKRVQIELTDLTTDPANGIGDFLVSPAVDGPIPYAFNGYSDKFAVGSLEWKAGATLTTVAAVPLYDTDGDPTNPVFAASNVYTVTFTVTPKPGYTFKGILLAATDDIDPDDVIDFHAGTTVGSFREGTAKAQPDPNTTPEKEGVVVSLDTYQNDGFDVGRLTVTLRWFSL
jgi:hypothetical protein